MIGITDYCGGIRLQTLTLWHSVFLAECFIRFTNTENLLTKH